MLEFQPDHLHRTSFCCKGRDQARPNRSATCEKGLLKKFGVVIHYWVGGRQFQRKPDCFDRLCVRPLDFNKYSYERQSIERNEAPLDRELVSVFLDYRSPYEALRVQLRTQGTVVRCVEFQLNSAMHAATLMNSGTLQCNANPALNGSNTYREVALPQFLIRRVKIFILLEAIVLYVRCQ